MLGKLFRNEFKCTWKAVLTVYAVVAAATILGCLFLGVDVFRTGKVGQFMATTFILSYVLAIAALFLVTFIFLGVRFYKTMYSDQGYLTHTIPVSPLTNLNVKLVTSLVWMLISGLIFLVSVAALAFAGDSDCAIEIVRSITLDGLNQLCNGIFGYGFFASMGILFLFVIFGCLNALGMIYAALSLGQLFNQHKIGASIGCGIGIYFIQQIISSILLISWMNAVVVKFSVTYAGSYRGAELVRNDLPVSSGIIWPILIMYAVYAALEYLVTAWIVKKHINLD